MTVLGCLLVTGLITLEIMSVNYQSTTMSIIIIPWILDISWLGQLLSIIYVSLCLFGELGYRNTGKI